MSDLLQYEKNLEQEIASFLTSKGLKTYPTRGLVDLEASNIQVALEYQGAIDTHRQLLNGYQEYDLHQGSIALQISTFREEQYTHHERLGSIRAYMLNGQNGFKSNLYTIFDLMPEVSTHSELPENNLDQSLLSYSIKWKVDLTKLNN